MTARDAVEKIKKKCFYMDYGSVASIDEEWAAEIIQQVIDEVVIEERERCAGEAGDLVQRIREGK